MEEIKIDLTKKTLEALLDEAAKEWDDIGDAEQKGKGYRFVFSNLSVEGADVEKDGSFNIYGSIKYLKGDADNQGDNWFNVRIGADAKTLGAFVEFINKSLNRFKAALEAIGAI